MKTATSETIPILAEPVVLHRLVRTRSQPNAQAEFEQLLARQFANTEAVALNRPQELLMDSRGRVQGRYRWTAPALSQLCAILAPGLSQTVQSVAGPAAYSRKTDAKSGYQPALAISLLNALLRLRFEKLDGYQLVIDVVQQQIAGLVGRRYAFISNLDFYERLKDFVSSELPTYTFQEAAIHGRRMALRYRSMQPVISIDHPPYVGENFYAGVHFGNSETGDCSVKAAATIVRKGWNTVALSPFGLGYKLPHIRGKRFERKFAEMLSKVYTLTSSLNELAPAIESLMATGLKLGSAAESHSKQVTKLRRRLIQLGLRSSLVTEIVDRALIFGSYNTDLTQTRQHPLEAYASRTVFDLFNALSFRAKFVSLDGQERAEQLAYNLLLGRVNLSN